MVTCPADQDRATQYTGTINDDDDDEEKDCPSSSVNIVVELSSGYYCSLQLTASLDKYINIICIYQVKQPKGDVYCASYIMRNKPHLS